MRGLFAFSALLVAAVALPAVPRLPEPRDLALLLSEEQFEDYLDFWTEVQQRQRINTTSATFGSGCSIRVNGDLGQPQPVYLHNGDYIVPTGTTGVIHLNTGEQVTIACTGSGRTIVHPNLSTSGLSTATATCVRDDLVAGAGWLAGEAAFGQLTCSAHSYHDAEATSETCYNGNTVIRVGYNVDGEFYPLYRSCFDPSRLEVLYVQYELNPANAVHQTGVDRPSWLAGSFYPGVAVNSLYTQVQHKLKIASLVGEQLADKYVDSHQFLSRGHLVAKSDMIFATGQRSTFYFINAAPQWQPFNGGNWNSLEYNSCNRIGVAGYQTVVYTGTFGVSQLRNQNNELVDIYLYHDANNNPQLPVPLYFYKVIYEPKLRLGTAFVGINNPYYSEQEYRALTFCTDRCRNNRDFDWVGWLPDRADLGYSFCCDVDDFRRTVPHLPAFPVDGLLA